MGKPKMGIRVLTPKQEKEVIERYQNHETYKTLAKRFSVSVGAIQRAVQRNKAHRGPGSKLTLTTIEEVVERYRAGEQSTDLADEYGVTFPTIIRYCQEAGISIRQRGIHSRVLTDEQEEVIFDRYAGGEFTVDLADEYGVSNVTIRRAVQRQGGKLRVGANRKALPLATEVLLVEDYIAGEGRTILGKRYGVSVCTVAAIVKRHGIPLRGVEVNEPHIDVLAAIDLYCGEKKLTELQIGEELGVCQSVVNKHLRRAGIDPNNAIKYRKTPHDYFDTVDPERAYFAGFIAADGGVLGNNVRIALSSVDRDWLVAYKKTLNLEQPIFSFEQKGRVYVGIVVTSKQWCAALKKHYGIIHLKAKKLRPPPVLKGREQSVEAWSFVRGYFDGDGHASIYPGTVQITSGSKIFLIWIIRKVMRSYHSIYLNNGSWGCRVSGPMFRKIAPQMYAGSKPVTRLGRKYKRIKKHVDIPL